MGTAPMHHFHLNDLPPTPWKNGGGSTREIVAWPKGAGMEGFDVRASVACIAHDGPFSPFAGVDRHITLLQGGAVRLRTAGIDHTLAPLVPFAFAGEAALHAELLAGTSQDFNLMTRRSRCTGAVRVWAQAWQGGAADGAVLLAWRGRWQVQAGSTTCTLHAGEGWRSTLPLARLKAAPLTEADAPALLVATWQYLPSK
ncbi:MAG: HutD family protein [Pseudomonadota bacterium]|nr:HutD family protein [Pseudomonadota bacterium]